MTVETVEVAPAALERLSTHLDVHAEAARTAGAYLMRGTVITNADDGRLFGHIRSTNEDVRATVHENFRHLADVVRASSLEVSRVADSYRTADDSAAARLAGRIDGGVPTPVQSALGVVAAFRSPAMLLAEPEAEQPIPSVVDHVLSLPDLISPGHWVLEILQTVCGVNPAEYAADWASGDWEAVARASDALAQLSRLDRALADGITHAVGSARGHWTGEAARAAEAYFGSLAQAVTLHGAALQNISRQYHSVAYGMWALAKAVVSLLEALLDAAMRFAITQAAAVVATSTTGVGGLALSVWGAYDLFVVQRLWTDIVELIGQMQTSVSLVTALVAGLLGDLHGLTQVPLPKGAYDHPGV